MTISLMGALPVTIDIQGMGHLPEGDLTEAIGSLTIAERFLCRRLIARQLTYGRNAERDIRKYGLEGTVKLSSARAIGLYMLVISIVAVGLALTGQSAVAVAAFALLWLVLLALLGRAFSAARSGREWRRSQTGA